MLTAGDVDYAISWVPKVLGSIEQGAGITDVAQIFERSATTQISFKDKGITSPGRPRRARRSAAGATATSGSSSPGMQKDGVGVKDIKLVQQAFDMNGFLAGDIDAAQAMTYNEYAQVLETRQPEDRRALPARGPQRHRLERRRHRDAPGRDLGPDRPARGRRRTPSRPSKFIKASIKGWVYVRDNPEASAPAAVTTAGSQLGDSHQLWMTNEVNKLIWPSTDGIGMIDEAAWDQTVDIATGHQERDRRDDHHRGAAGASAYTNEYVEKALDELVTKASTSTARTSRRSTVTLNEGGN